MQTLHVNKDFQRRTNEPLQVFSEQDDLDKVTTIKLKSLFLIV
jgi:hypothetical protein